MAPITKVEETVQWTGKTVPVYAMETVSFESLLSQEPAEVEKVLRCCETAGFFYLDMRGIDGRRYLEDQQNTIALMKRFFAASLEEKNQYGLVAPHLGYEPVGSRTGVFSDTKDGYEMIKVSRDEIQRDSPHLPEVLKNSADMKTIETSIAGCNIATKTILSALSTAMGLTGAKRFENSHRNARPSSTTLAMMHYIPSPATAQNIGHQKHTDISTLTLLFTEQWGLQIRPPGAKEFGFVRPEPGCAIVNVGDSLRFASGMKFQSCIHRVVPFDPTEHRYSIAYFLRAEDDTMFTDSEGRYITAGQWHDEKFFAFTDSAEGQAMAPPSMLLGGMVEEVDPEELIAPQVIRDVAVEA
ncbi:2og-Fe oxygenase family protein [Pleomassaria siparia CBS 279.74]|uniref:2og-Fe oxygenase family protein n=1 Tax=Pleomassaria siparia CBS 279.74 TaxID=1314801 RepID=A0A6G1KT46_9PLEO|nr:2og-Fe oxygenase family protein [Pleomassaria siparia CBS 279.74]